MLPLQESSCFTDSGPRPHSGAASAQPPSRGTEPPAKATEPPIGLQHRTRGEASQDSDLCPGHQCRQGARCPRSSPPCSPRSLAGAPLPVAFIRVESRLVRGD